MITLMDLFSYYHCDCALLGIKMHFVQLPENDYRGNFKVNIRRAAKFRTECLCLGRIDKGKH